MRKKTENMDIIVDKKTVRVTTAVFVTVMTMLAAIAAMFFTTMSVLAADAGNSSNSQSTISTTVPDSHNIRVEKSHTDVVIEGEEDQIEGKLKKVVKGIVRNYRKELARRQAKEVSFCELPEIVVEKLIVWDDYESEYTTFDVCGTEIRVLDEELAEALKQLPEQNRNIVLMFFFLDMSDSEIGEKLNINRSTSYRHRRNSLEEIRKQLKEKKTNEE